MKYNKYIYMISILLFAIISGLFINNKENFENIHTLSLDESKFYPEACGSIISFSGSSGCPKLSNYQLNELLARGGNNTN